MPSPIGHSLAAYAIYSSTTNSKLRPDRVKLILFILVANLPDIDFLPGFLVGYPNKYHHQFTHSLSFAVIIGVVAYTFLRINGNKHYWQNFLIFSGLILSHVILDFFTLDTSAPYGEQLLWPFTGKYYLAPASVFRNIQRAFSSDLFISSLFNIHNLWTVAFECVVLFPAITIIHALKKKNILKVDFSK